MRKIITVCITLFLVCSINGYSRVACWSDEHLPPRFTEHDKQIEKKAKEETKKLVKPGHIIELPIKLEKRKTFKPEPVEPVKPVPLQPMK